MVHDPDTHELGKLGMLYMSSSVYHIVFFSDGYVA